MIKYIATGLILMTTACASIVSDNKYPVSINSNPAGANVEIKNKSGGTVFSGTTPTQVMLEAGSGYFSREHYNLTYSLDAVSYTHLTLPTNREV